jgi:hypothetical protein
VLSLWPLVESALVFANESGAFALRSLVGSSQLPRRRWRPSFPSATTHHAHQLTATMSTAHSWPPALTEAQEGHLLSLASDYSLANGLVLRPPAPPGSTPSTTMAIHAPYSLLPSPFLASLFEQAKDLQPLYNALYAHVTVDDAFLDEVVGGAVAKVDEFQGQVYKLWKKVSAEGIKQVSSARGYRRRRD